MEPIVEPAYAKLNLSLDVLARRDDGYHDLEMVFQLISLKDELKLSVAEGTDIRVASNARFLPSDRDNIAYRCAETFFRTAGMTGWGADIYIEKRIPVCAGLGGGSADGAAVFRALNRAFSFPLTREQLLEAGASAGADIPFCLIGGTAVGRGKGEILEPLPGLRGCFVVVKPSFSVSTPELFHKLDSMRVMLHPDTEGLIRAIRDGRMDDAGRRFYNVFEDALSRERSTVEDIKSSLLEQGALGAAMTGTGSAVFGLFRSREEASRAAKAIAGRWRSVFVAEPVEAFGEENEAEE